MTNHLRLLLLVLAIGPMMRADEAAPRYFGAQPGALAEAKARLSGGDPSLLPALRSLEEEAKEAMRAPPPSVMQKGKTPPSGDKHDYLSTAPYYWPDPKKPDGLPYIRHDGKVNPESRDDTFDHGRIRLMADTVETLALAYYFTGKEAYAEHAASCLRAWFLDPATRMNPNLNYAQGVPGVNEGRGTGIIEGRNIADAADAAGLLAGSPAWTQTDRHGLDSWLQDYFDWLRTSRNGLQEAAARNNHGTIYDMQAMRLALVLGRAGLAREIAEAAKQKRIAVQIEPDGRQPLELERTTSLGYSAFNLEALFLLATLAEHAGVDLWHCQLPDGRGLARALAFLLPYAEDPLKKWPYEQIKPFNRAGFAPLLRQAARIYHEPKYEKMLTGFRGLARERFQLLCPAPSPGFDVASIDRERILKAAGVALALPPITITQFRAALSEGGPNDFYSNGDYWWPDPAKTNGLPYLQRDGQTNPGNFNRHRLAVRQLRDAVAALGAAYQVTGEDRYAGKAAELLRVFFLDPSTRMNPHLQYAQAVPGRSPGRGIGIIDTLHLIEVPAAASAMRRSPAFPPATLAGLKSWFSDYLGWMLASKNGQEEAVAKNNHAVAFWLQVAVFARFTGDEARLAEARRQYQEVFLPNQMAADGSFPLELKRTKPYAYSIFQLDNMATLCQVLSTPTNNLWHFELPDGRGIRKAAAYLAPFLADKSKWPLKPDVQAWDGWPTRQSSLLFAGLAFGEQGYLALWKSLPPDPGDEEVQRNLAITQPLLWVRDGG
ncbi:MAG: alginate lyase family protein [Verrucomicrobiota bacterium]